VASSLPAGFGVCQTDSRRIFGSLKQFRATDVGKISVANRDLLFNPVARSGD
jgi:hypothetical protein